MEKEEPEDTCGTLECPDMRISEMRAEDVAEWVKACGSAADSEKEWKKVGKETEGIKVAGSRNVQKVNSVG